MLVQILESLQDDVRDDVGATGDRLLAAVAVPDSDDCPLDAVLAAEGACVAGVLGDFDLLCALTERGTVTSTVFTGDADLLTAVSVCSRRDSRRTHS